VATRSATAGATRRASPRSGSGGKARASTPAAALPRSRLGLLTRLMLITALFGIGLLGGLSFSIVRAGHDTGRKADCLVILGAHVNPGGVPSLTLAERTDHAARLWKQGRAPYILCSGGLGDHALSEAQVMRRRLRKCGVPASAIVMEDRSHSTAENARYSARLMRRRGWRRALLVTDTWHEFRALRLFRGYGVEAHPAPATKSTLSTRLPDRAFWTLRECAALLRGDGWRVPG
jgi:uncharacterized SAM-binding protein YcdF (DUF218 family)